MTDASRPPRSRLPAAVVFGVAFGWVEAVVVVYLRRLYYPAGFHFPLAPLTAEMAGLEAAREFATLVMLAALAWAGARTHWGRLGLFAVAFGVWDLAYYAGLRIALGWPASLGDWDVLFLIPIIWTGPVWAPALVSVLLVVCGAVLHQRGEAGRLAAAGVRLWLMAGGALAAILAAFLANHRVVFHGGTPTRFPSLVFFTGVAVGLVAFFDLLRVSRGR